MDIYLPMPLRNNSKNGVGHPSLSSFAFDAETKIDPLTLDNIIAGFDEALQEVMEQAVEWTLRTGAG